MTFVYVNIIEHVCYQQRVSLDMYLLREKESLSYSIFNVKHCKRREKRKIFLALNFRLAIYMLQLIYALKKAQQLSVSNAFPAQDSFERAIVILLHKLNFSTIPPSDGESGYHSKVLNRNRDQLLHFVKVFILSLFNIESKRQYCQLFRRKCKYFLFYYLQDYINKACYESTYKRGV
jgi:hypothetical protein